MLLQGAIATPFSPPDRLAYMSTLSERLRSAMAHADGMTQVELARQCGVKQPSVSGWLSGKSKFLRGENLLKAAAALDVSDQWLATGDGSMARQEETQTTIVPADETHPGYVRLPLLEGYAGMGRGDYIGDYPEVVQFVEVTQEWLADKLRGVPADAVRVITGRGDSMRGQYADGDLVFIDSRVKHFVGDAAYCYRWSGQVQIKRLQLIGDGVVRILSENDKYPPIDANLDDIEIGGRALAAWTLTDF